MTSFIDSPFDVGSEKASPYLRSFSFSPMLSSRSFILYYTVRSMMLFELIFVKNTSSVSRFIYLHLDL